MTSVHRRFLLAWVVVLLAGTAPAASWGQSSSRLEQDLFGNREQADLETSQTLTAGSSADLSLQDQDDADRSADRKTDGRLTQDEFLQFMRIRRDAQRKPIALETSITRYETVDDDGNRITVDLIGVVHVGEEDYYRQLNEQFQQYDAMLYELVAPEGTRIPKGGREEDQGGGINPVAAIQMGLKSMLALEFQLDHIDYMADNLVHADMSPEEFFESMKENEESFGRMFLNSLGSSMAMQSKGQAMQTNLLLSIFSKNKTRRLRQVMAEQMQDMESGMAIFQGKDGSTIIEHRNAKVMKVLQRELAAGKQHVAIFYGAGHLPDMQRRLMSDFQMKRGGRSWLTAWDLTGKSK